MADNSIRTPGTGENVASDEVTYSGDTAKVQVTRLVHVSGAEGSKTVTELVKAEDAASADGDVGIPMLAIRQASPANTSGADGDYEMLRMSAGRLWASATIDAALPAGTNTIGQTAGTVAHDAVDSGNPHKIGARAASSLASATLVAAGDRTDLMADVDGALITRQERPLGDTLVERVTDTGGTSTALTSFGATASAHNCIDAITVYNDSTTAGFVDIRDGTAGSVIWTIPLPPKGGGHIAFPRPLRQPTANTALAYDVSAALTTVYLSFLGFKSKA